MTSPLRILRVVAVAMASVIALATPAQADILLEFDRLISGVEGSVRTIGEVEVAADLVGQTCQVSVIGENQASVHPGNDLIVSTGGSSEVVVGVEDEVDAGINHTSQLVLGPTIVVQLRFGPDELSSLGFSLSFDCTQPVTTTTSTTIATTSSSVAAGSNCGDAPSTGAATADGPTESGTDGSDCAPLSCTDDGSVVATTVTTAGTGSAAAGADGSDCAPVSCTDDGSVVATTVTTAGTGSAEAGADGSDCAPANCTDGGAANATSGSTGNRVAAEANGCPEPTSNQISTTTAPPTTTVPTTVTSTTTTAAPSGSATAALPPSPVATAIVAAPAYAG